MLHDSLRTCGQSSKRSQRGLQHSPTTLYHNLCQYPWSAECRVRRAECRVWKGVECGVKGVECGVKSVECGVEIAQCGVHDAECGILPQSVGCGVKVWDAESKVESAECRV
ncbi:salivary gland secretion protein 4 [Plakobranchus ocellatus]|uniref:Salivary gland secretion protein 4 n=1 Tax=Plakobranchus ocellatus TaxID=259542 RepID=A0AAV3XU96_9GAST|nr:salivary gland secretion protein 4 [Plakobranchus ocellatus]